MTFRVVNTYSGEISEIVRQIDKLQNMIDDDIIEWNRVNNLPSKIFQLASCHVLFSRSNIEYYQNLSWCSNQMVGHTPKVDFNGSFVVPYLNIFVTGCSDYETYKSHTKEQILEWFESIGEIQKNTHWMILHVVSKKLSISVKNYFNRSVFERLKKDFSTFRSHGKVIQLIINSKNGPSDLSNSWKELVEAVHFSHRSCLLNYIAENEAEIMCITKNIDKYFNYSLYELMKISYNLYMVYKQMTFEDELSDLYVNIYNSLSSFLKQATSLELPSSLKEIDERTRKLLCELASTGSMESFQLFLEELSPKQLEAADNPILRGDSLPRTFFSLLSHISGALFINLLLVEHYSFTVNFLMDYLYQFPVIYARYSTHLSDRIINFWQIETSKWFLQILFDERNKKNRTRISGESSPNFVDGVNRLLKFLMVCLQKSMEIHLGLNIYKLEDSKFINFNNNDNLTMLSPYSKSGRYFSMYSLRASRSCSPSKESEIALVKTSTISERSSRSSLLSTSSLIHLSFSHTSLSNITPSTIKPTSTDAEHIFENGRECFNFLDNFFYKRHTNVIPVSSTYTWAIIDKFSASIRNIPPLYSTQVSAETGKSLIKAAIAVSSISMTMYDRSHNSRMSLLYYFTTARLLSISKYYLKAVNLYSYILSDLEISKWPNIWIGTLFLQLESLCGFHFMEKIKRHYGKVTVEAVKDLNIFEKLKNLNKEPKYNGHIMSTLLYLSCKSDDHRLTTPLSSLFFSYFLHFINIFDGPQFSMDMLPIFSLSSLILPERSSINIINKNKIQLKILSSLTESISLKRVAVKFSPVANSPILTKDSKADEMESGNKEKFIYFELNDVILDPGFNTLELENRNIYVSNFIVYKMEMIYNEHFIFTTNFGSDRPIPLECVFAIPQINESDSIENKIVGFWQIFTVLLSNESYTVDDVDGITYKIISHPDLFFDQISYLDASDQQYKTSGPSYSLTKDNDTNSFQLSIKGVNPNTVVPISLKLSFIPSDSSDSAIDISKLSPYTKKQILFICSFDSYRSTQSVEVEFQNPISFRYNIFKRRNFTYIQINLTNISKFYLRIKDISLVSPSYGDLMDFGVTFLGKETETIFKTYDEIGLIWRATSLPKGEGVLGITRLLLYFTVCSEGQKLSGCFKAKGYLDIPPM